MIKHLNKSPMQESVLHIRCDLSSLLSSDAQQTVERLNGIMAVHNLKYEQPIIQPLPPQAVPSEAGSVKLISGGAGRIGERYHGNDNKHVVQVFTDGVAISWLKPYDSWDSFKKYAFAVRDSIIESCGGSVKVDRIGLRAINRIVMKCEGDVASRYFKNCTRPNDIPGAMRKGFVAYDSIVDASSGAMANITRTVESADDAHESALMYDIDAFYLPRKILVPADMDTMIEDLHGLRDKIFFSEMTDAAMEEFK